MKDEGPTLETSALNSLRWPIHVINSVEGNPKSARDSHEKIREKTFKIVRKANITTEWRKLIEVHEILMKQYNQKKILKLCERQT